MPRPKNLIRNAHFHTVVAEDLKARLDLCLFSEIEGRVPYGSYQVFLTEAINQFLAKRERKEQ